MYDPRDNPYFSLSRPPTHGDPVDLPMRQQLQGRVRTYSKGLVDRPVGHEMYLEAMIRSDEEEETKRVQAISRAAMQLDMRRRGGYDNAYGVPISDQGEFMVYEEDQIISMYSGDDAESTENQWLPAQSTTSTEERIDAQRTKMVEPVHTEKY